MFVTIDRATFCSALESKGFSVDTETHGELVYQRQHAVDPTMWIKIYTSLPKNKGNTRSKGSDAIRVVLIFKNEKTGRSGCLYKAPKVLRTGTDQHAVIERTIQRARDAYAAANERLRNR